MMTLEEIFKEYEKGCGNTCLDGKPSDCKECLGAAVRAVNRYHAAELATLRAENERLREAMVDMAMTLNKTAEYQVAELMAENERLREALKNLLRAAKVQNPLAGFPQAEEALK